MRGRSTTLLTAALSLLVATSPRAAFADKFGRTLDVSLSDAFSSQLVDGTSLKPSSAPPPSLSQASPVLRGDLTGFGPAARVGLTLMPLRFGVGAGFSLPLSGSFSTPGLAAGHEVVGRGAWSVPLEAYVALALGKVRWARPYLELRGLVALHHLTLETTLAGASQGSQSYSAVSGGLMPRLGVLLWLNSWFFADLGGGVGLVGSERYQLSAGVGLPIPLANL